MLFSFKGNTSVNAYELKPLRKEIDFTRAHITTWQEELVRIKAHESAALEAVIKEVATLKSKTKDAAALEAVRNFEKMAGTLKEVSRGSGEIVEKIKSILGRWDTSGLGKHVNNYYG